MKPLLISRHMTSQRDPVPLKPVGCSSTDRHLLTWKCCVHIFRQVAHELVTIQAQPGLLEGISMLEIKSEESAEPCSLYKHGSICHASYAVWCTWEMADVRGGDAESWACAVLVCRFWAFRHPSCRLMAADFYMQPKSLVMLAPLQGYN